MDNLEITKSVKEKNEVVTNGIIRKYLDAFGFTNQLESNEIEQFLEIAKAYQLNPFKREVYCIPYVDHRTQKRKLSIITGYEVYLKRAERLNVLDGWDIKTVGSVKDDTLKASVTIFRKDWRHPFSHEVDFSEYNQNNYIWKSKPKTMIKKVCIAQAFRLAFPDEFGGMPYISEELPDEMTELKEEKCTAKTQLEAVKKVFCDVKKDNKIDFSKLPEENLNLYESINKKINEKVMDKYIYNSDEKIAAKRKLDDLVSNIVELRKYYTVFERYTESRKKIFQKHDYKSVQKEDTNE